MNETPAAPVVFLSYARADRERIDALVRALNGAGQEVWWDALIEGGDAFAKTIEGALDLADAVVVAWSVHSVASDWVRDEAMHGRDRGRLVPISLDGTLPPLGFRQYHFIDFSTWRGSGETAEFRALMSAIAASGKGGGRLDAPVRARRIGRRAALAGTGLALALAGGGFAAWRLRLVPATVPDNSIAVLPFANLSGDPAQTYFSDGLSAELRDKLTEAGGFNVAAQTSSEHFRKGDSDPATIGQQLGVAWLLDGSVRRAGDSLRVSAELIDAANARVKWQRSFDRQMRDVFAVQSEIALTVIQAITGQIPGAATQLIKSGTSVVAAYDAYLKGSAEYASASGLDADRRAVASFDAAIAADPNYAMAHVLRAEVLLDIASESASAAQMTDLFADAMASVRRATELAPQLGYAWLIMGETVLYSGHDFRAATPYFDKAHALTPRDPDVLAQFALFVARQGRLPQALAALDQLLNADRLNSLLYAAKGRLLYYARRWDDAARLCGQALAMHPGLDDAQFFIGLSMLARGELAQARTAFQREPSERARLTGLAVVERRLGASAPAEAALATLRQKFGDSTLWHQAMVLAQWGRTDDALTALETARAKNTSGLSWMLVEPLLDPLHAQPRFKRLLASQGLG